MIVLEFLFNVAALAFILLGYLLSLVALKRYCDSFRKELNRIGLIFLKIYSHLGYLFLTILFILVSYRVWQQF